LQAFALDWSEAADGHSADERDIASACSKLGGDSRGYLKRASDAGVLSVVLIDLWLGDVVRLVRSGQGNGPDLIAEQTDFLALVLRPCDRLNNRMGRPGVSKVEVVQRVAGVGGNPSLVVGRGAGSLGLAVDRLDSSSTVEVRA
jgi:hypothetical protein